MSVAEGYYRRPTRADVERSIPASWIRMPAIKVGPKKYVEIIDWVLDGGVVDRGVKSLTEMTLAVGLLPDRFAWELIRSGVSKMFEDSSDGMSLNEAIKVLVKKVPSANPENLITYDIELAFASDEDAVMFQMRFM
jgi:hypothetical protein